MKRKISIVLIIIIMVSVAIFGYVVAVQDGIVCRLHASFTPNNPRIGADVKVELSATEINEGISSITVSLNYDEDIFTLSKVETGIGWTQTNLLNTYLVSTENSEPTTKIGSIITFYLTVKDNVKVGTKSEISLTSIQASTDGDPVDFDDLKQEITIFDPNPPDQSSEGNNETSGQGTNNETSGQNAKNETSGQGTKNETSGQNAKNETSGQGTKNEIGDQSAKNNNVKRNETVEDPSVNGETTQNSTKNDTTEANKIIPQTGSGNTMKVAIIGFAIISIISYIIYRKNKI